jgi:uncharacterized protein Smg (DUF494 family)
MSERWLTLINGLTQRLLDEPGLLEEPLSLIEEFVEYGYQHKEVEISLAWIGRFLAEPSQGSSWSLEPLPARGHRARSVEEQISFSPEAFGYLIRLENSGIIDPGLREEILERALGSYDEEIGEEEIRTVSRLVLQDHGLALTEPVGEESEKSRTRNLN